MARTIKAEEHEARRNEILDTVLWLIYTKGYERMTIQDILNKLGMSSGAFYHYYDSKPAVLEAFVERMQENAKAVLLPIVHDPHLAAIEKLQGFFDALDSMRISQQADVLELIRVWYKDENAIVRQKVDSAMIAWRVPALTEIVWQGIQEGVFKTVHPDDAGGIMLSLLLGMGNHHAKLMLSMKSEADEQACIEGIVSSHDAYMDAMERILGAAENSLHRTPAEAVKVWVKALRKK